MKLIAVVSSLILFTLIGIANAGIVITGADATVQICSIDISSVYVSGTGASICNVTSYNTDFNIDETCTLTNTIVENQLGDDINIANTKTVTGTYNCFDDAVKVGDGTYSDSGSTTLWSTDPLFVDRENGNFYLKAGSPCIDAGILITGITMDIEGVPVPWGLAPDIGAYEYSYKQSKFSFSLRYKY